MFYPLWVLIGAMYFWGKFAYFLKIKMKKISILGKLPRLQMIYLKNILDSISYLNSEECKTLTKKRIQKYDTN